MKWASAKTCRRISPKNIKKTNGQFCPSVIAVFLSFVEAKNEENEEELTT